MAKKALASVGVVLYKVLVDGCSVHGGDLEWSLPTEAGPGDWHSVEGDIVRCENGLHLTDTPSYRWREGGECYLVETNGPVLHEAAWGDEYVARKVRLVRRLTWAELAKLNIHLRGEEPRLSTKKKGKQPPLKTAAGPSPAMEFVRCAWENRCVATAHSWRTVNATMSAALMLAVTGGMSFAKGDFAEMSRTMRGGYWFAEGGERYYREACKEGNLQACQSYEDWTGRTPFMWEGKRLYLGSEFMWEGASVVVTSFQDEAHSLIACSYKPGPTAWDRGPIARRFTVANEALAKAERSRKAEALIHQDATLLRELLGKCRLDLSIETLSEWSPEERVAAVEWAKLAEHDARKTRVKPVAPPPHLEEALKLEDERRIQRRIEELRDAIQDAKDAKDRAESRIANAKKELAKIRGIQNAEAA